MKPNIKPVNSIAEMRAIPFFSQFTDEQLRDQVRRSIEGMEVLKVKAIRTGKKVNSYTLDQIQEKINNYNRILGS